MLKYYFSSDDEPFESSTNDGLESVSGLLEGLNDQGVPVDQIDVAKLTDRERADAIFGCSWSIGLKKILRFGKYLGPEG